MVQTHLNLLEKEVKKKKYVFEIICSFVLNFKLYTAILPGVGMYP